MNNSSRLGIRVHVKGISGGGLHTSQFDLYIVAAGRQGSIVGWTPTEDSEGHLISLLTGGHAIDIPGLPRTGPGAGSLDGGRFIGCIFLGKSYVGLGQFGVQ